MSRLLAPLAAAAALLAAGCGARPGDPCTEDAACGPDLLCSKPTAGGAPAATGLCTFPFQAEGARCLSSGECAPGFFCSNELSTDVKQFSGVCTAAQTTAGSPCLRDANCAGPLRCQGRGSSLGTCQ